MLLRRAVRLPVPAAAEPPADSDSRRREAAARRRTPAAVKLLGVILDFDGVIADTEPIHLRAFQDALAGGPMTLADEEYWERYLGLDDAGLFVALARDRNVPLEPEAAARLATAKADCFAARVAATDVVYPAARRCIEQLAADGTALAVASGALHHEIEAILTRAGLLQHFVAIVAADDVPASKPAPDTYVRAVELLCNALGRPVSPAGFVAVEDSRWGIDSANAAGLPCAGVTTSYTADELTGAAAVVESLDELDRFALTALLGH
ncbi:MAG: HAD family phosphatase [Acidobacteria bacterium]|nr:HAD family phosphatase [Acidobacteriota bacterium]